MPHARINDYASALADPQTEFMNWIQDIDLPGGQTIKTFSSPIRLNGQGFPVRMSPPALGQHTQEVKQRYGVSTSASVKD